jgi:hypothetical protein
MTDALIDELLMQIRGASPAAPAPQAPKDTERLATRFLPPDGELDPRLASLRNFLGTVLPENGPVYFAVTIPPRNSGNAPRHYACRTIDELASRLLTLEDQGHEVYFATASYQQVRFTDAAGKSRQRCGENVAAARACWLDIDVGENKAAAGHGYATQEEARQALATFSTELRVVPSLVVSSGRGLHVYYAFEQPVSPAEWKHASRLLKHACTLAGLRADGTRTEDVASILRPIGCTHRKDAADPRRVALLSTMARIPFASFLVAVQKARSGLRTSQGSKSDLSESGRGGADWPAWNGPAIVNNDDLVTQTSESVRWLRNLAPDDQLRTLDEACSTIPVSEWSQYESWQAIITGFRGLHHLDEAKRLEILERHSAGSPKWDADGWNSARLREKFLSFDGGSARRLFELAEAHGWRGPDDGALTPFSDQAAAEQHLVERFIFVKDQGGYLDTNSRQLITSVALDESESWLTIGIGKTPRRILKDSPRTRRADSLGYNPGAGALYRESGRLLANLYVPWAPPDLQPTADEQRLWDWFIDEHLFRRPEDKAGRDYFLDALAFPLQHPGRRVASVPLLIGEQPGSGKSTLVERVPRLVFGDRNVTVVTQSELESGFNDWHANAQMICFPEIWMGGANAKKIANDLKDKITNDMLRVYPKGLKGYSQPNRATLLGTSNYEDAIHLREGDRRWGVHITDAPKLTPEQSKALYSFLESDRAPGVLRSILRSRDLSAFNPAGDPPMTAGKCRVIAASRSVVEAEIVELFENREPPFDRDVFSLDWVRTALIDRVPGSEKIAPRKLAAYVQTKPISAVRLTGRKRIKAKRTLAIPGASSWLELDGKHGIWCIRNAAAWEAAPDKDIAHHLETGAPLLATMPNSSAASTVATVPATPVPSETEGVMSA